MMSTAAPTAATPAVAQFLQTFGFEHQTTMNVLKALPADKLDFKPHERSMTAGELAWHIATSQQHLAHCVAQGRFEFRKFEKAPASLDAIVAACDEYYHQACALLAPLTDDQLQVKIELGGGHRLPASALMWNGVLFHQIHHRGELVVYLRQMGARVPPVYGPSGDESPYA